MSYRFKEAQIQSGKSVAEVAKLLQAAETSVRNWVNGMDSHTPSIFSSAIDFIIQSL